MDTHVLLTFMMGSWPVICVYVLCPPTPNINSKFIYVFVRVHVTMNFFLLQVLELLLDYAYSSRVIINEENAESLLEAGDMLQFHDIRDAAAEFLEKNLHSSNCLGMMLLSDAHQCKRLYELSWRMCLLHYETVNMPTLTTHPVNC